MGKERLVLGVLLTCARGAFGIFLYSLVGGEATGEWTLTSTSSMLLGVSLSFIAFSQLKNMKAKQQRRKLDEPLGRERR
ncbi:MAG: hypothetical protein JJU34_04485 [Lunatimonas sp.]|uniref:hypothetical protein n=1 Tax=Lunatimonas sp. TaxID=2060141 RepID=UPI00263B225C|nr:hypothetical protein [Lunatimonas sp.]MCC5936515.1 hypothetical protein [Lunatimonas sp.]